MDVSQVPYWPGSNTRWSIVKCGNGRRLLGAQPAFGTRGDTSIRGADTDVVSGKRWS